MTYRRRAFMVLLSQDEKAKLFELAKRRGISAADIIRGEILSAYREIDPGADKAVGP